MGEISLSLIDQCWSPMDFFMKRFRLLTFYCYSQYMIVYRLGLVFIWSQEIEYAIFRLF